MAFPQVRSANTSFTTTGTTHTVNMPATVTAGDLLVVFWTNDGSATVTFPTGWEVTTYVVSTNLRCAVARKVAVGDEGGTTISVTTSGSESTTHIACSVQDWYGTLADGFAIGTATAANTANPNPPALNPASWDIEDTLWFAIAHINHGDTTVTTYPTSYTDGTWVGSGGTQGVGVAVARRTNAVASEDPDTFTISASRASAAQTIGIRPSGVTPITLSMVGTTPTVGSVALTSAITLAAVGITSTFGRLSIPIMGGYAGYAGLVPNEANTYTVTNTNDSGAGSLREALTYVGGRKVVFQAGLSGTITLATELVPNVGGNWHIEGSAALGVKISGQRIRFDGGDVVVRYLYFFESTDDSLTIRNFGRTTDLRYWVDHCTFEGPNGDGSLDNIYNSGPGVVYGTVSHCHFQKSWKVSLIQSNDAAFEGGDYFVTWHDNWLVDNLERQPLTGDDSYLHFFRNVVERYGTSAGGGSGNAGRGTALVLAKNNVAMPRVVGEVVGYDGSTVTAIRLRWAGPLLSNPNVGFRTDAGNQLLTSASGTATETEQNAGTVDDPPYGFDTTTAVMADIQDAAGTGAGAPITLSMVGITTSIGSVGIASGITLAAAGVSDTVGQVGISVATQLAATGVSQTVGSVALSSGITLAVAGATPTAGSVAITSSTSLSVAGTTTTIGFANITVSTQLAVAGVTATSGLVSLNAGITLSVIGATPSAGQVSIGTAIQLSLAGTTGTAGSVDLTTTTLLAVAGTTTTVGHVQLVSGIALAITGVTPTSGSVDISISAFVSILGTTGTTGSVELSSLITLAISGTTPTAGVVPISTVALLAIAGTTSTTGSLSVASGITLALSGVSPSAGTVSINAVVAMSVSGATPTIGTVGITTAAELEIIGSTPSAGSVGLVSGITLDIAGTTSSVGSVDINIPAEDVQIEGATASAGEVNLDTIITLAAAGSSGTQGTVAIGTAAVVQVSGSTPTLGQLWVDTEISLSITGTTGTFGLLNISDSTRIEILGTTATVGSVDFDTFVSVVVVGATQTVGQVDLDSITNVQIDAGTGTVGQLNISTTAGLDISGSTLTDGDVGINTTVDIDIAGTTTTTGLVDVTIVNFAVEIEILGITATNGHLLLLPDWYVRPQPYHDPTSMLADGDFQLSSDFGSGRFANSDTKIGSGEFGE